MTESSKVQQAANEVPSVSLDDYKAFCADLETLADRAAEMGIFIQATTAAKLKGELGETGSSSVVAGSRALALDRDVSDPFISIPSYISVLPSLLDQGANVQVSVTIDDQEVYGLAITPEAWVIKGLIQQCLKKECMPYASADEYADERNLKGNAFVKEKLVKALEAA